MADQTLRKKLAALWQSLYSQFVRLTPTERQRLLVLTVISGGLCGLGAVAFHQGISKAESLLINRAMTASGHSWIFWTILTPALGGLIAGVGVYYWVPGAVGSGVPQVKAAYALQSGYVSMRDAFGKFLIGILQVGSGAALGREGPTVQICAGISNWIARAASLSRQSQRRMAPVGVAAGIAAAFNAPIAAVTFTLEEVIGDLDQTMLAGAVIAAAIAAIVERSILGQNPVFAVRRPYALGPLSSLIFYAVLGLAGGVVSVAFTDSLLGLRGWFKRFKSVPQWVHPAIGGAATGLLAVIGLWWLKLDGITGGGYDTLSNALTGAFPAKVFLGLCLLKLGATVFSYASGGVGGIFAPALFIGGMLGGAIGYLDVAVFHHSSDTIGAFALVGMGAVFAGIIRAPMTSVLIIFEMTGGYGLILPLMIANMTAYLLARHWRGLQIYEALLVQDGVILPRGRPIAEAPTTPAPGETPP